MQNFFNKMDPSGGSSGGGGASDGAPWWLKYGAKGIGIAAGIAAMFFGLWVTLSLSPLCIVAGIWQICAGFLVILVEAPFCCMFLDFVQKFSGLVENRPIWQKATLYLVIAIVPLLMCTSLSAIIGSVILFSLATLNGLLSLGKNMCFSLSTLLGSGGIFAASVVNGMQIIGKKASVEEMANKAGGTTPVDVPPTYNEAMGSGLVDNIQGQDIGAARSKK